MIKNRNIVEPANWPISKLVQKFLNRGIKLPEMQRKYVWKREKVRVLVDSIYKGYLSCSIPLWETDKSQKLVMLQLKEKEQNHYLIYNRTNKSHRTAIDQTWDHMRTCDLDWEICTSYKYFALLKRNESTKKGYFFDFEEIAKNKDKLRVHLDFLKKKPC